jgi:4-carboxymuconolactone decarboxylase
VSEAEAGSTGAPAGARLSPLIPSGLSEDQRALYSEIAEGPRAQGPQHFALKNDDGALLGPFNAFLLSPILGRALQEVGAAVRFATKLTPRIRELAILVVAAHWDSAFERSAHESVGRAVGLTENELVALREGTVPTTLDAAELAALHITRALAAGDISDSDWARWATDLGNETVFELSTLVGYYSTLALQLRVFRVLVLPGVQEGPKRTTRG